MEDCYVTIYTKVFFSLCKNDVYITWPKQFNVQVKIICKDKILKKMEWAAM